MVPKAILCFVIVSIGVSSLPLHGQANDALRIQLQDPNPSIRSKAFYRVIALRPMPDQFKVALINLLKQEKMHVNRSKDLKEDYENYYAEVVQSVAELNDPRAVDALLDVIDTGYTAVSGVASLGAVAIDPTIARLSSKSDTIRNAAVLVLNRMLEPDNISKVSAPASISKVAAALKKASADTDKYVRSSAAEGLAILEKLHFPTNK